MRCIICAITFIGFSVVSYSQEKPILDLIANDSLNIEYSYVIMESADMVALREYDIQEMHETILKYKIDPCNYDPEHIKGVRGAEKYLDIRCRMNEYVSKLRTKYPEYSSLSREDFRYMDQVFMDKYYTRDYKKLERIKNARNPDH